MESVVVVGLGAIVALLVAIVMELRTLSKALDHLRVMVTDAIGISPPVDLMERAVDPTAGTVSIPTTLTDLQSDADADYEEEPRGN